MSGLNKYTGITQLVLLKIATVLLILAMCFGAAQVMKQWKPITFSSIIMPSFMAPTSNNRQTWNITQIPHEITEACHTSLIESIHCYASNDLIVIASFDVTYASMALNLYLTSFKRFNIINHLFVASDHLGCGKLEPHGAHCVQYSNLSIADGPSVWNRKDYNIKANVKPRLVLDCLKTGVSVLLVDLDIVFLKNPLPVMTEYNNSDIMIQLDNSSAITEVNSGFFLVRPTKAGIELFDRVVKITPSKHPKGDQVYVNIALNDMKARNQIKEQQLDPELYSVGNVFFTKQHRMFIGDNPCTKCVIVHNNYIVSVEAKRYRFMEYGLWAVDDNGYYSNKDRKYIQFDNPVDFTNSSMKTRVMELKSLKFALTLGYILNRTVLFPRFHCKGAKRYWALPDQRCHFGAFFCVRKFETELPILRTYRENVFLKHPLVPKAIKTSKSGAYVIDSEIWRNITPQQRGAIEVDLRVMKPGEHSGVTVPELRQWFSNVSHSVLVFHSLYNDIVGLEEAGLKTFISTLDKAIITSDFMQLQQ